MNIAVVDSGGNLIAHERTGCVWIGSIDISIKKAFTSRAFDILQKRFTAIQKSAWWPLFMEYMFLTMVR